MPQTLSPHEYKNIHSETIGNFNINQVHRAALEKTALHDGMRVLDIGCGNGELLFLLKEKRVNIFGIDFDTTSIETARTKTKEYQNIQVKTENYLEYQDDFFDVIYCIGTIGYLSENDRNILLKEIYRVLKKDGKLIIRTSTKINFIGTQLLKIKNKKYQSNTHFYSLQNYIRSIKQARFQILSIYRSLDLQQEKKLSYIKKYLYILTAYFLASTWIILKK